MEDFFYLAKSCLDTEGACKRIDGDAPVNKFNWKAKNYTFGFQNSVPKNYFCVESFSSKNGRITVDIAEELGI